MTDASRDRPIVAFLGPKASYTHQAALNRFPESQYELAPQITIEDVFAAVQTARADHGVVPFENSSNGSVVFTLDLFADPAHKYPDLIVHGEVYVSVRHCLLGPASSAATEGNPSLSHITKLYSHPQAWGQCKQFLGAHFHGVERLDVSSTSRAAEMVAAEGPGSTSAAISSKMAATSTGLATLAEGIEDVKGNSTRFLVLRRRRQENLGDHAPASDQESTPLDNNTSDVLVKSLVTFSLHQHGSAGALAECLAVFKQHELTLTSINTRPSGEAAWHYIFFVEFLGRSQRPQRQDANHLGDQKTGDVNDALAALGRVARTWRWLGSWNDELRPKS